MDTKKLIGTIIGVTLFAVLIAGATFAWLTFGTTLGENTYNGTSMNFIVDYTKGTDVPYMPILDSKNAIPGKTEDGTVGISETTLGVNESSGLVIVMKKNPTSTDGHAVISLTTTSTTNATKDGIVRWAICRDTTVEDGDQIDNTCGADGNFSKALNTGLVSGTGTIILLNDALLANGVACQGGVNMDQTSANIVANTKDNNYFYSSRNTVGSYTYNTFTIADSNHPLYQKKVTQTCPGISVNGTGTTTATHMLETDGVSYFVYFWLDGESIKNAHLDDQEDASGNIVNDLYAGYIHASANQLQN